MPFLTRTYRSHPIVEPEQRMTIDEALEHPFLKTEMQLSMSRSSSGDSNNEGGITNATTLGDNSSTHL